jgi:hypothetical protein
MEVITIEDTYPEDMHHLFSVLFLVIVWKRIPAIPEAMIAPARVMS